jgi:hypothetical protein
LLLVTNGGLFAIVDVGPENTAIFGLLARGMRLPSSPKKLS